MTPSPVLRQPADPVWLSAVLDPALERSLLLLDTSDLDWRHTADKHGAVSNAAEATLVAHIAAEMVQVGQLRGVIHRPRGPSKQR